MRDRAGAEFGRALDRGVDDQITVRHQQWILTLIAFAGPHERLDEVVPKRRAPVDRDVRSDAQLPGARLDVRALVLAHATGIGKHGVHLPAAFREVWHAEAGVETAGKGEN